MRIVHFGTYSVGEGYPRNAVVAGGLRKAGAEVVECRRPAWRGPSDKARGVTSLVGAVWLTLRMTIAWAGLAWEYLFNCPPHDIVLVGYSGHLDVFFAKALAVMKGKPVVLDAFLSVYEAVVEDRRLAQPGSLRARALRLIDRASSNVSDAVLLDTEEHIKYYKEYLNIPGDKFIRVFVGGEDEFFHPLPRTRTNDAFEALFFGSFLPLHGADVIVGAIKLLDAVPDLHFTMVGDGPEWERCKALSRGILESRITWERNWVHYDDLARKIADADICLGIFGAGGKASRVIPCKVFNALAMGAALITADTPAAREALVHKQNAWLTPPGDPEALSKAIVDLKNNPSLRESIAAGGLETYRERFSEAAIGSELLESLGSRLKPPYGIRE